METSVPPRTSHKSMSPVDPRHNFSPFPSSSFSILPTPSLSSHSFFSNIAMDSPPLLFSFSSLISLLLHLPSRSLLFSLFNSTLISASLISPHPFSFSFPSLTHPLTRLLQVTMHLSDSLRPLWMFRRSFVTLHFWIIKISHPPSSCHLILMERVG